MLWLHARTRFSQARAELGLSDLDIDEEAFWVDAENGDDRPVQQSRRDALMAGLRYGSARSVIKDIGVKGMSRVDYVQARALRQKADGLEKVLSAIMDQCSDSPPETRRSLELDDLNPSSSSSRNRTGSKVRSDPSVLPNSVRIRLAVGALINILFSGVDDSVSLDSTTSIICANSSINLSSIPSSLLPLCLSGTESAKACTRFVGNGHEHPAQTDLAIFNFHIFSQPLGANGMLFSF
jgi:hypothetical protein